jgi:transcriptional regulator NrdR family protein
MKKMFKIISMPLAFVYLLVSTLSCTTSDINKENELLLSSAKNNSKKAVSLFIEINRNLSARNEFSRSGLTQEMIDEYLVNAGCEAGSVTLETVNAIVEQISEKEGLTFEEKINSLNFSATVKNKLIEMKESGYIEDLQMQDDFQDLTLNEKEILLNSNEMVNEFYRAASDDTIQVPCPSEGCTGVLILAGAGIGSAICGPPCGVIGGVIGLIIGTSMKP